MDARAVYCFNMSMEKQERDDLTAGPCKHCLLFTVTGKPATAWMDGIFSNTTCPGKGFSGS